VTVTTVAALVDLIGWFGKAIVLGVKLTGATPLPVKAIVCGEFEALSLTVMENEEVCTAVGENVTASVHVLPPASAVPQLFVCANGAVVWMPEMARAAGRLFDIVTFVVLLVVPAAWFLKFTAAGENVTGMTPFPDNATDCGEFAAESVITRDDE
jgi:hypothetical protein